jgi:DNA repair protein RecN (Recombination protein N)
LIETLRIENLAIVESEEIEFGPGLNVLTGETGAGKSIVLGALSLLAGSRASPQVVREGCDEAVVEAVFRTDHLPDLESSLQALGLVADEHELVVRRSVQRGGRSRARVAGQLIPAAVLAELFSGRIEISSQHDSQSLLKAEFQSRLLDTAARLLPLRSAVAEGYGKLRALDDELAELRAAEMERERRRDFLSFQVGEIDDARLDAAEIEALRAERSRLAHAERLREEASAALTLLAGDLGGPEASNAADLVSEAVRRLEGIEALDPQLAPLLAGLRATREELRDTATELERYAEGIEADPARLAALDERLAQIEALQRKYGGSIEEILRFRSDAATELARLEGASERAQAIDALRARQVEQLAADGERLSGGRRKAGRRLGGAVESALRELAMPQARFELALEPVAAPDRAPCGPGGFEAPEFRFSASARAENCSRCAGWRRGASSRAPSSRSNPRSERPTREWCWSSTKSMPELAAAPPTGWGAAWLNSPVGIRFSASPTSRRSPPTRALISGSKSARREEVHRRVFCAWRAPIASRKSRAWRGAKRSGKPPGATPAN